MADCCRSAIERNFSVTRSGFRRIAWHSPSLRSPLCSAFSSIVSVIVVGLTMIEVWMALFRSHPDGRFRFIYNWLHRGTGCLALILFVSTTFLIVAHLRDYQAGLYAVISIWTGWVVLIVIILELINYRTRKLLKVAAQRTHRSDQPHAPPRPKFVRPNGHKTTADPRGQKHHFSEIKLILLGVHVLVVTVLAIPFIVLIWKPKPIPLEV